MFYGPRQNPSSPYSGCCFDICGPRDARGITDYIWKRVNKPVISVMSGDAVAALCARNGPRPSMRSRLQRLYRQYKRPLPNSQTLLSRLWEDACPAR